MGVRGLLSYCRPIVRRIHVKQQQNQSIGIDAYSLFYSCKSNMERATKLLKEFLDAGHRLTMVVDRRASQAKEETVRLRKSKRTAASATKDVLESFHDSDDYTSLTPEQKGLVDQSLRWKEIESWHMTSATFAAYRDVCSSLGIAWVLAEEEADVALAAGVYEGLWSIVLSTDSDLLVLGVPTLWMLLIGSTSHVNQIRRDEFQRYVGLSRSQVVELALLAGCDSSPKKLVRIDCAVSWLKFYGSLGAIHRRYPDVVGCEDMVRFETVVKKEYSAMSHI